jgi:2-polyprenyl-3-methyl-5-hydroxy-6-metoxy-1,4-benzoquinol methylase
MMKNFDVSVLRFDQFAAEYAQRFMDTESYSTSIDRFCDLIGTGKPKILELGCGPGNITRLMKLRFPESDITAIDLAPNMIEIARKQLPDVDFRVKDVRDISTIPEKFNAVMCSFCLPFLSKADAAQLIADCSDRLFPEGVLYLSTMEGSEEDAGFETTSFSGNSEVYFNYHRQADLENTLLTGGFVIDRVKLQDYHETDGSITTDLIFIAVKRN